MPKTSIKARQFHKCSIVSAFHFVPTLKTKSITISEAVFESIHCSTSCFGVCIKSYGFDLLCTNVHTLMFNTFLNLKLVHSKDSLIDPNKYKLIKRNNKDFVMFQISPFFWTFPLWSFYKNIKQLISTLLIIIIIIIYNLNII